MARLVTFCLKYVTMFFIVRIIDVTFWELSKASLINRLMRWAKQGSLGIPIRSHAFNMFAAPSVVIPLTLVGLISNLRSMAKTCDLRYFPVCA